MRIKTKLVHYTIILFDGLESVNKDTTESRSHGGSNNSTQGSKSDADQGLPANGERPSEVIPDDLQVRMTDCSHLSFGSFGFGMSYVFSSGPSASMPVNSNLEEDHRDSDVSSVEHSNTRNSEHFGEDSLKNPPDGNSFHKTGSESYDASQPEEMKMVNIEMAHGNQYAFPPSTPDYTFDNAQHLNAAFAQSQTNSQMQNLSSFSNVMKQVHTNSLPSTMLAANVHSSRESDLQYSPFSVTQSLPTKSGNSASSIGGSTISMPEALKTSSFPSTQPTPESLFGKNVATGPPLPQHLPVHPYSQPSIPLGPFAYMIGYPFLPQSFTYMPSAFQQQFAGNNTYHQSSAAILPQYKNSVSVSSLPQSAAVASGYDGFGSTTTIPGNFLMNMPTAPSGTNLSYDDVLSSRYKDSNHLISLQQVYFQFHGI
ncbi:Signaling mucin HKR1 [Olea europaea subsp. europaea]|uniref:Signaling mucin HKR1 n=1 Tax=Olea europaea subsp. europaea TaxID=158383 RepID=A0A8S0TBM5_OLEEU|nr:Signaling mucin HKR1 [Olea europaea subsp. europaea]